MDALKMKYILKFAASVLVLFSACTFSQPKDYQKVWMDEPLSLHDMMLMRADKELEDFLSNYISENYLEIPRMYFYPNDLWNWMKKPKDSSKPFLTSLYFLNSSANYSWKEGIYVISTELAWEFSPEFVLQNRNMKFDQGLLANTQKNIANACEILLNMLSRVYINVPFHKGYSNKKLEDNLKSAFKNVIRDTKYSATIYMNTRWDKTNLVCSKTGNKEITHDFRGDWHLLADYEKRVRDLDESRGWHKER
jgi:hypothetical protein